MNLERHHGQIRLELRSEHETDRLGQAIASVVGSRRTIGLIGDLGAGKTRLSRAIAEALDVEPTSIASPTYVLIHEYRGQIPITHFDAYRLPDPDAFDALGASEYFEADGLCLVEWADLVIDRLPGDAWLIRLNTLGPSDRTITIEGPDLDILAGAIASA